MRYLKRYKIFESDEFPVTSKWSEIEDTLNNIILELKDEGFDVRVRFDNSKYVNIRTPAGGWPLKGQEERYVFKIQEVSEYINRIISYMRSEGYLTYVEVPEKHSRHFGGESSRNMDINPQYLNEIDYPINFVGLTFKKKILVK